MGKLPLGEPPVLNRSANLADVPLALRSGGKDDEALALEQKDAVVLVDPTAVKCSWATKVLGEPVVVEPWFKIVRPVPSIMPLAPSFPRILTERFWDGREALLTKTY